MRKNYGSNESHTYAAPKKYGVANKFERSKDKSQGLRKNSSKVACTYQALKSTINNFSNLARYNNCHMKKPSGSENVSLHHEGPKNFPLRDITKQIYQHELNEELRNEYIFDVASTESDQNEDYHSYVREGKVAQVNTHQEHLQLRSNENRPSMSNSQLIKSKSD